MIARTGADAAHRLNVTPSKNRLRYTNKHICPRPLCGAPPWTSTRRPAAPFGNIAITWIGTDALHHPNAAVVSVQG